MKQFRCGDVVPGCRARFTADDEAGVLTQVAEHARRDHGMPAVPPELVARVRGAIVTVPA